MPIYEYACPRCRRVFNFLSKRLRPEHPPVCPKCGNKKMAKQLSAFALPGGAREPGVEDQTSMPDMNDPRLARALSEIERDMAGLDENNPQHMAHMMKKMKALMPAGSIPTEFDIAIKRLAAGEDPEKIEAEMGDIFGDAAGGEGGRPGSTASYSHDSGLYDY